MNCRLLVKGRCLVHRYGTHPSAGVCGLCEARGQARVLGVGDVVAVALAPALVLAGRLTRGRVDGDCSGCRRRQARLNGQ